MWDSTGSCTPLSSHLCSAHVPTNHTTGMLWIDFWYSNAATCALLLVGFLAAHNAVSTAGIIYSCRIAKWRIFMLNGLCFAMVGGFLANSMVSPFLIRLFSSADGKIGSQSSPWAFLASTTANILLLMAFCLLRLPVPASLCLVISIAAMSNSVGHQLNTPVLIDYVFSHLILLFAAPLFALVIHYTLEFAYRRVKEPLDYFLSWLPYINSAIIPIHLSVFIIGGLRYQYPDGFGRLSLWLMAFVTQLTLVGLVYSLSQLYLVNRTKRYAFEQYPTQILEYSKEYSGFNEERMAERGMVVTSAPLPDAIPPADGRSTPMSTRSIASVDRFPIEASLMRSRTESCFIYALLSMLFLNSIVQGIIDFGLARGLFSLLLSAYVAQLNNVEQHMAVAPYWILFPTAIFWIVGFSFLSKRLVQFLGRNWQSRYEGALSPMAAFCIEIGTSLPTLLFLYLGLPVSPLIGRIPATIVVYWIAGIPFNSQNASRLTLAMFIAPLLVSLPLMVSYPMITFIVSLFQKQPSSV